MLILDFDVYLWSAYYTQDDNDDNVKMWACWAHTFHMSQTRIQDHEDCVDVVVESCGDVLTIQELVSLWDEQQCGVYTWNMDHSDLWVMKGSGGGEIEEVHQLTMAHNKEIESDRQDSRRRTNTWVQ